jgi:hypothetical protein
MAKEQRPVETVSDTTRKAFSTHVADMTGALTESALYGHHGHLAGSQGKSGHPMPANQAHLQKHSFIPRDVGSRLTEKAKNGAGDSSGASYSTTNEGMVGDCDSTGSSGY